MRAVKTAKPALVGSKPGRGTVWLVDTGAATSTGLVACPPACISGGDTEAGCLRLPSPDSVPNAVWIWDIQKLRLFVVLEQLSPVRSFQWDPQQPRLAICTGGGKVYLWSPAGCVSVQVPGEGERSGACDRL